MRAFSIASAAIASLFTMASANTCDGKSCSDCGMFINTWNLKHDGGVDFSGPFCKGFWNNLTCPGASVKDCGNDAEGKGFIVFNVGIACNEGDIESAWWRATKNEFGSFSCVYSN